MAGPGPVLRNHATRGATARHDEAMVKEGVEDKVKLMEEHVGREGKTFNPRRNSVGEGDEDRQRNTATEARLDEK